MEDWSSYERRGTPGWHLAFSDWILRVVKRLPRWKIGPLPILQAWAEFKRRDSERFSVKRPADVTIQPALSAYYDVFFTEDFDMVERGLASLLNEATSPLHSLPFRGGGLASIFEGSRGNPTGTSWHNIGHLCFEKYPAEIRTFRALDVELLRLSPSCIALFISSFPTDAFRQRFLRIINKDVDRKRVIHLTKLFPLKLLLEDLMPLAMRRRELEELFLEMNQELVSVLREHIHRGWSSHGPLPSVEVFSCEAMGTAFHDREQGSQFWRSLGLEYLEGFHYSDSSGLFLVPPRSIAKDAISSPHRCVVDVKSYLSDEKLRFIGDHEHALHYHVVETLRGLVPMLALREHAICACESLSDLRERISPSLAASRWFLRKIQILWHLFRVPFRLSELRFKCERMKGCSESDFSSVSNAGKLRRTTRRWSDDGLFADDLRFQVDHLWAHLDKQLSILHDAYRELWNFCIQWILVVLGVAALVMAGAQILKK
ncbi:hypothetical protein ACFL01_04710 [Planctomycetota bacterium]